MPIIDQPTPSHPGAPVPEQRPLNPGERDEGNPNKEHGSRTNLQTPETVKHEIKRDR